MIILDSQPYHLAQMDATAFLRELPSGSVDLVITDPAYESLEKHRKVGTTTRLKKQWFEIFPNSRYPEWLAELYRVLKKNSHCYIFCDEDTRDVIKPLAIEAGFKFWKSLIWDKDMRGMGYHFPASYEFILFLEKGKRNLNTNHFRDVLKFPNPMLESLIDHPDPAVQALLDLLKSTEEPWTEDVLKARTICRRKGVYPTEKNEELLKVLVSESSAEGEIVLDTFTGSGSTGAAALSLGRRFLGCDIADASIEAASMRLAAAPWPEHVSHGSSLTLGGRHQLGLFELIDEAGQVKAYEVSVTNALESAYKASCLSHGAEVADSVHQSTSPSD